MFTLEELEAIEERLKFDGRFRRIVYPFKGWILELIKQIKQLGNMNAYLLKKEAQGIKFSEFDVQMVKDMTGASGGGQLTCTHCQKKILVNRPKKQGDPEYTKVTMEDIKAVPGYAKAKALPYVTRVGGFPTHEHRLAAESRRRYEQEQIQETPETKSLPRKQPKRLGKFKRRSAGKSIGFPAS